MDTSTSVEPRKSRWLGRSLLLLGLAGLVTVILWGSQRYLRASNEDNASMILTHDVTRGDLMVTVTEDGNVESASNVEIKCKVAGGSSILWIVPDGSTVKKGDRLVELDSSSLDEQINQQRIVYEKARSTKIQADKAFEVAKLAVREYLEGTFKKEEQDADALITISLENLRSAQNSFEHGSKMFRKGFVSSLELETQKFGVERAELELDSARTAKEVLVNFTKVKMLQDLESQRDTAEAQMKSETAAFQLEESRLKRLEDQLTNSAILAPQPGMVVYANERSGRFGQNQASIEEGAAVRERQTILRLPDLSQMQVKVNVHESKVDQLDVGMRASIRILDRVVTGQVTSIANQPEPTGFFSANVKEYATVVRVDGEPEGLRPGMTAEVEILVAHVNDVITIPVVSVVERRGKYYAWVRKSDGTAEKRNLVLGYSNDKFIEVKDGVAAGETVFLNPRTTVAEARDLAAADDEGDDATDGAGRFGERRSSGEAGSETADGNPGDAGSQRGERRGGERGAGERGRGRDRGGARGGPEGSERGPGGDSSGGGARRDPAQRGGGGRGGQRSMDFSSLDTDGDGKLSKDEAPERMRPFFDRVDANSDGFIEKSELEGLRRGRPQ